MYRLSVGALFRNETHILREWIEHYLHHGVEHFYLINDGSTDSYMEILQPYIDTNTVTLFDVEWSRYVGRQRDMYTRYILPHIKETDWLLIADLDEFVWTPHSIDLCHVLNSCHNVGQIQMKEYIFGSNGHIEQPKNVVNSFTMRSKEPIKCYKYFVKSTYDFTHLNVHHATFLNKEHEINNFLMLEPENLMLNHYCCQSKNYWMEVKCTRGDSDSYRNRNEEDFNGVDVNEVHDDRLLKQNTK
jgi:hypothetical protein